MTVLARPLLSIQQRRIMSLVSAGHTNREIGALMVLSEDTVKCHLRVVFRKLEARDRAHAVRRCFECGIFRVGGDR